MEQLTPDRPGRGRTAQKQGGGCTWRTRSPFTSTRQGLPEAKAGVTQTTHSGALKLNNLFIIKSSYERGHTDLVSDCQSMYLSFLPKSWVRFSTSTRLVSQTIFLPVSFQSARDHPKQSERLTFCC